MDVFFLNKKQTNCILYIYIYYLLLYFGVLASHVFHIYLVIS